jgi:hypothetical protein
MGRMAEVYQDEQDARQEQILEEMEQSYEAWLSDPQAQEEYISWSANLETLFIKEMSK